MIDVVEIARIEAVLREQMAVFARIALERAEAEYQEALAAVRAGAQIRVEPGSLRRKP
jgi:phosphopantetheinyl transferase (holo-ACP synthase)